MTSIEQGYRNRLKRLMELMRNWQDPNNNFKFWMIGYGFTNKEAGWCDTVLKQIEEGKSLKRAQHGL